MRKQPDQTSTVRWVAGDVRCGQLAVELQRALAALDSGDRIEAIIHSEGAQIDVAAWCYLAGHTLVESNHPTYIIEKSGD